MEHNKLPRCPLRGADGNIFNILAIASRTLRNNGMADQVEEMRERAQAPGNDYHMALGVVFQYVMPVGVDEPNDLNGPGPALENGDHEEDNDGER